MPAKRVLQYECDSCPNVWYVPEDLVAQPKVDIEININVPGENPTKMKFECLCEGCLKTVTNLLVSVGKVSKKVSANRKAKKKDEPETASKDSSSPAVPATTKPSTVPAPTPPAAAVQTASPPKPAVSIVSVPAVASGAAGKAPPLAVAHPKK